MEIRTRVAPSPTGYVHIGTIYNAIFAHALAKAGNGKFILRIEDTDQKRSIEGATEELYEMFNEFGLEPDEGPMQGGDYGPYVQSEKVTTGAYKEAAEKLIESGHAYYCFHTEEELAKFREENSKQKVRKVFRSDYRDQPIEESRKRIAAGDKYVIRLKVPENETIEIEDAILGKVSWQSNEIDDQVILKSDGFPTYHLAVVVDDHDMRITHVTRGYDWIPSTPKQVLLYKYLGFELPVFAHNGLILDPAGGKLSKRKGNVSAKQFLAEGYLVEAMINFLILIGWSPDIKREHGEAEREIFSHEEFIKMYKLEDRKKSSGIFDKNKLVWFNQQYIMSKTSKELGEIFKNWMEKYKGQEFLKDMRIEELQSKVSEKGDSYLESLLELEKTRVKLLSEIPDSLMPFYFDPVYSDYTEIKQIKKLTSDEVKKIGERFLQELESFSDDSKDWKHEEWENKIRAAADQVEIKHGQFFMVLRYLVTGRSYSPPLFEIMQVLGKEEIKKRIENYTK